MEENVNRRPSLTASPQVKIEVCVLGSGAGIPNQRRRPPALVVKSAGHLVLFDCGAGALWTLAQAGMDFRDLDWVWFSHFHPDHTGDLVPLLFAARSPRYGRKKPLVMGGATGLKYLYQKLRRVHGSWIELPPDLLALKEIVPDTSSTLDLPFGSLSALPMAHTPESLGYRLQTRDGLSLAYSGDTDYCANAVTLAREVDLFFCECAFPDQLKSEGHLTPRWAGRVAREAGCKRLVLTHLYPACDEIDVMAECSREFSGEIVVAEDLMWFHLSVPHSHPSFQES